MERMKKREVYEDLSKNPSSAEVVKATGKLKNGKAPGSSDIFPEMLKVGCWSGDIMRLIV